MKNFLKYNRRNTNKVFIGNIPLGKGEPVRLQSMTNTNTSDIEATVNQIIKIAQAGADYVRITVPTSSDANKIVDIKNLLLKKGFDVPLIADIHFSAKAAEISAKVIEKVRINPGNYSDKKQFKHIEYTDKEYSREVKKLKENFIPLLKICKEHNTTIRIGTNHGSLSDRIMSRYGDTPLGMVESTMEFLRICDKEQFKDVVISMKAGNPIVMIHANRLLVKTMEEEDMNYPVHIGVTEAGNNDEGRIKSAIGIASLLVDGIGDTIRVSLTEAPEKEIPVAKFITEIFNENKLKEFTAPLINVSDEFDPFSYHRRKSTVAGNIGGENVPVVISDISEEINRHTVLQAGFEYVAEDNSYKTNDSTADYLYIGENKNTDILPKGAKIIYSGNLQVNEKRGCKLWNLNDAASRKEPKEQIFIKFNAKDIYDFDFALLKGFQNSVLVLDLSEVASPVHAGRSFFFLLEKYNLMNPVILMQKADKISEPEIVKLSGEIGALFIDGFGDGIWISTKKDDIKKAGELSFGILQACRTRITRNDYISCPTCGRTLFNLEETTAKIKEKTAHLKGLKIGIMGCIVNGPGEMADADFGYVGTGKGKITLYKKQKVIKRNIPEEDAVNELLKLIEQYS